MSATTPRRTSTLSTSNSPSKSSPRRVLGDLTPKTINSPSKQRLALDRTESTRSHSPLKEVQTMSQHMFTNKENTSNSRFLNTSRKRNIYEVDDVENIDNAIRPYGARDMGWARTHTPITAGALRSLPDFANVPIDPPSPTERNTPSPEPELELDVINNSQNSNQSFSELVNYDFCASQPSTQPVAAPVVETKVEPKIEPKVDEKPSKAAILSARLRLGMYKLKTNQVNKSSSDVIAEWESSSSISLKTSTSSTQSVPNITLSPVHHDSNIHLQSSRPLQKIPKLSGGPVLLPTAYSSRMIHDYQLPSSPPQAISPQQLMSPVRMQQHSHDHGLAAGERLLGFEYSDDEGDDLISSQQLQRQIDMGLGQGGLPNSVVIGDASLGLKSLSGSLR